MANKKWDQPPRGGDAVNLQMPPELARWRPFSPSEWRILLDALECYSKAVASRPTGEQLEKMRAGKKKEGQGALRQFDDALDLAEQLRAFVERV